MTDCVTTTPVPLILSEGALAAADDRVHAAIGIGDLPQPRPGPLERPAANGADAGGAKGLTL